MGTEREQAALEAAIRKHMEKARHLVTSQAGACSAYGTDVHQHLTGLQCPEIGPVTVEGVAVWYKRRRSDHEPSWHTAPLVRCGDHTLVVDTTIQQFYPASGGSAVPGQYEIVRLVDWPGRIVELTGAEELIKVDTLDAPQGEGRALSSFLAMTAAPAASSAGAAASSSSGALGAVQLALARARASAQRLLRRG